MIIIFSIKLAYKEKSDGTSHLGLYYISFVLILSYQKYGMVRVGLGIYYLC